jgi:hypothetical protein
MGVTKYFENLVFPFGVLFQFADWVIFKDDSGSALLLSLFVLTPQVNIAIVAGLPVPNLGCA